MKIKKEIRNQILLRLVNKSNQVIDDIGKLTMQIHAIQPNPYRSLGETPLFISHLSAPETKN